MRGLMMVMALAVTAGPAIAQPVSDLAGSGLSAEGLHRTMAVLQSEVDAGRIGGAVFGMVSHGKVVFLQSIGMRDKPAGLPMTNDALFPLASMTKPLASVALMTLVEQGRVLLHDPVANYIPAFKDMRVAKEFQGGPVGSTGPIDTVPANRLITVQDLLRHTAGLVNGGLYSRTPVRKAYVDAGVYQEPETLAEEIDKVAHLPLAYQPGTHWDYSQSVDVSARIVEIVSGKPFDQYLASVVTGPLGMDNTVFNVPEAKGKLVAQPLMLADGSLPTHQDTNHVTGHFQGNTGLVASAPDYLRFIEMLLGHGALGEARILGGGTVDLMRSDALGPILRDTESGERLLGPGYGFGLGFAVRIAAGEAALPGSVGAFGWSGAYGTQFVVDPARDIGAVLMVNQQNQARRMWELFPTLVYQTMLD
jgi:CubicO group peptidase (beta-lactamase class C family)